MYIIRPSTPADIPAIRAEAERLGLTLVDSRHMDDWACVKFVKHS